jgi:hypothetical protein
MLAVDDLPDEALAFLLIAIVGCSTNRFSSW